MNSGVSSGYHSLERQHKPFQPMNAYASTDARVVAPCPAGQPMPMANTNMALENIPPVDMIPSGAPQPYPISPSRSIAYRHPPTSHMTYPVASVRSNKTSPGRRFPPSSAVPLNGYMTPQQQIIQQHHQKVRDGMIEPSTSFGCQDAFRNWNMEMNPFQNAQAPPSVYSTYSNMSGTSRFSTATHFSMASVQTRLSVITNIDDDHLSLMQSRQQAEQVVELKLDPEVFKQEVNNFIKGNLENESQAKYLYRYLRETKTLTDEVTKPYSFCCNLLLYTISTLSEGRDSVKKNPELAYGLWGVMYYSFKLPSLAFIVDKWLNENTQHFIAMFKENLNSNYAHADLTLSIVLTVACRSFQPNIERLQLDTARAFMKQAIYYGLWRIVYENLDNYRDKSKALMLLRYFFETDSRVRFKFVNEGGLRKLLDYLSLGDEKTLYETVYCLESLVRREQIAVQFIQSGGISRIYNFLAHGSPRLNQKAAAIMRDTAILEPMKHVDVEKPLQQAVSLLGSADLRLVETVTGFICNAAALPKGKEALWKPHMIRDMLQLLQFQVSFHLQCGPDRNRSEIIDNVLNAFASLMNSFVEGSLKQKKDTAAALLFDPKGPQMFVPFLGLLATGTELEIKRRILMIFNRFLKIYPEHHTLFVRRFDPSRKDCVQIVTELLFDAVILSRQCADQKEADGIEKFLRNTLSLLNSFASNDGIRPKLVDYAGRDLFRSFSWLGRSLPSTKLLLQLIQTLAVDMNLAESWLSDQTSWQTLYQASATDPSDWIQTIQALEKQMKVTVSTLETNEYDYIDFMGERAS